MSSTNDLFTSYMNYVDLENQEAPAIYHRWTLASTIGALLGRQFYLPHGKGIIYPNQYVMLMGTPGARKGSSMNIGRDLLRKAGYARFSASKTSPERFLIDMKQYDSDPSETIDGLEALVLNPPAESYVFAGEFVDFMGSNDVAFINLFTNLWDNLPDYEHPKIHGKSVKVFQPTINLFGGSTPQTFAMAFPPEIIGTGFSSRLLLIHSEPTGKKIAWPTLPDDLATEQFALHLRTIREQVKGEAEFSEEARKTVEIIYKNMIYIEDARFNFYMERRDTHLKKLAMIIAAGEIKTTVKPEHVIRANTMLAKAERWMPKALGEFGKSKNATAAQEILNFLGRRTYPAQVADIWKVVDRTVSKVAELNDILHSLKTSEKIQIVDIRGKKGWMLKNVEIKEWDERLIDINWLTAEERI